MVDPATIVGGIVLLKKSIDAIKSGINTAKDVGDIASDLDSFFTAKDEIDKKASKSDSLGLKNQLGIDSVAQSVIDRKLAYEQEMELASMLNFRFGPNTYQEIKQERARRKREAKQRALRIKQEKERKQKELIQGIFVVISIVFGGAFILLCIYLLIEFL